MVISKSIVKCMAITEEINAGTYIRLVSFLFVIGKLIVPRKS